MRSLAGYWIGGALIVAAVAGAIGWAVLSFVGIADTLDEFVRVEAPGTRTVQLEARKYIVYAEGPGAGEDLTPAVTLDVLRADGDRKLPVQGYGGSLTYSIGNHSGTAIATVTPPRAGTYRLRAIAAPDVVGYGIALGDSIGGRIVRTILGALAIGALLMVAGIGLIIATWVRRRKPPAAGPPPVAGIAGLEG